MLFVPAGAARLENRQPGRAGVALLWGAALADGHVSLHLALEHVTIEKGIARGGSTAPPGED